MKSKIIFIVMAVLMVSVSCRTKEGEPGPAGDSDLTKQGSVSGKINYVDYNGKAVSPSFSYEYFESILDNAYFISYSGSSLQARTNIPVLSENYSISISRRDLQDSEKNFSIDLYGIVDANGVVQAPQYAYLNLSYIGVVNNSLFSFHDEGSESDDVEAYPSADVEPGSAVTFDVSNFSLDTTSGRLRFDYVATYPEENIYYEDRYDNIKSATVTGSVDVILYRKRQAVLSSNPPIQEQL